MSVFSESWARRKKAEWDVADKTLTKLLRALEKRRASLVARPQKAVRSYAAKPADFALSVAELARERHLSGEIAGLDSAIKEVQKRISPFFLTFSRSGGAVGGSAGLLAGRLKSGWTESALPAAHQERSPSAGRFPLPVKISGSRLRPVCWSTTRKEPMKFKTLLIGAALLAVVDVAREINAPSAAAPPPSVASIQSGADDYAAAPTIATSDEALPIDTSTSLPSAPGGVVAVRHTNLTPAKARARGRKRPDEPPERLRGLTSGMKTLEPSTYRGGQCSPLIRDFLADSKARMSAKA
jgi:hypothetical protein